MSYEIKYFPVFLSYLRIWYVKSFGNEVDEIKAFRDKTKLVYRFLDKEFQPISDKYKQIDYVPDGDIPKIVWILWWQGEENMPEIPKACLHSIKKWAKGYEIRVITEKNYKQYVNLDDVIHLMQQRSHGKQRLTIQYLSDLIRMRLLYKYGGIWIDSTIFAANDRLFKLIETLDFFTIRLDESLLDNPERNLSFFTPGRGGFCDSFWAGIPSNPFFAFVDECMTYHVMHHKNIWDYFIIEYAVMIGISQIPLFQRIFSNIPISNPDLYWLEKKIYDVFAPESFDDVCKESSFFKLDWRMKKPDSIIATTYFDYILSQSE